MVAKAKLTKGDVVAVHANVLEVRRDSVVLEVGPATYGGGVVLVLKREAVAGVVDKQFAPPIKTLKELECTS